MLVSAWGVCTATHTSSAADNAATFPVANPASGDLEIEFEVERADVAPISLP